MLQAYHMDEYGQHSATNGEGNYVERGKYFDKNRRLFLQNLHIMENSGQKISQRQSAGRVCNSPIVTIQL